MVLIIHLCLYALPNRVYFDRAFHHYREAQGRKEPLKKHPELDRLLRESYRSMDDFNRAKGKSPAVKEEDS